MKARLRTQFYLTLAFAFPFTTASVSLADKYRDRIESVTTTPDLVAFWDFVKREPNVTKRFTAHIPQGATNDFPLDAANYIKDYWGDGPAHLNRLLPARLRPLWQSECYFHH